MRWSQQPGWWRRRARRRSRGRDLSRRSVRRQAAPCVVHQRARFVVAPNHRRGPTRPGGRLCGDHAPARSDPRTASAAAAAGCLTSPPGGVRGGIVTEHRRTRLARRSQSASQLSSTWCASNSQHGRLCLVDVRWIRVPATAVEVDEHDERCPRGTFVAIGERIIPRQAAGRARPPCPRVRVEVLVAEAGLRGVKGGVCEVAPAAFTSTSAAVSVTCSASQKYPASERNRVIWRVAR